MMTKADYVFFSWLIGLFFILVVLEKIGYTFGEYLFPFLMVSGVIAMAIVKNFFPRIRFGRWLNSKIPSLQLAIICLGIWSIVLIVSFVLCLS